jgi:hypothetical protein
MQVEAVNIQPDRYPSDAELLALLHNGEDHLAERKTVRDKDGWVKTVVAFANSMPIGYPGVLFIGVDRDGKIQDNADLDFDLFQRTTVDDELKRIYPRPYCVPRTLTDDHGSKCLALVIPGSPQRPHFAGHSYIRNGSKTERASEEQFQTLIAERSSKVYEIRKWIGNTIAVYFRTKGGGKGGPAVGPAGNGMVVACNLFWVTLETEDGRGARLRSLPLSVLDLSYCPVHECLRLICDHEYWAARDSCG